VYLCVPLGSSLMCYRFLQVAWNFAHGEELPHHDHGHVDGIEDASAEDLLNGSKGAKA
jgi:C4-dicarboxylate transporter DctQ subunit